MKAAKPTKIVGGYNPTNRKFPPIKSADMQKIILVDIPLHRYVTIKTTGGRREKIRMCTLADLDTIILKLRSIGKYRMIVSFDTYGRLEECYCSGLMKDHNGKNRNIYTISAEGDTGRPDYLIKLLTGTKKEIILEYKGDDNSDETGDSDDNSDETGDSDDVDEINKTDSEDDNDDIKETEITVSCPTIRNVGTNNEYYYYDSDDNHDNNCDICASVKRAVDDIKSGGGPHVISRGDSECYFPGTNGIVQFWLNVVELVRIK